MSLDELDSSLKSLQAWARTHHVTIGEGMVELADTLPQVTVRGFEAADLDLFLLLALQLKAKVVALDVQVLDEEDLRVANALAGRIGDIEERANFNRRVSAARARLGEIHTMQALAFSAGLERALVYQSSTDWGEDLFGLVRFLAEGDEG